MKAHSRIENEQMTEVKMRDQVIMGEEDED